MCNLYVVSLLKKLSTFEFLEDAFLSSKKKIKLLYSSTFPSQIIFKYDILKKENSPAVGTTSASLYTG